MSQSEANTGDPEKAKSPSTLGQQAFDEKSLKNNEAEREGVEPLPCCVLFSMIWLDWSS
jgi:hypothetical protein